MQLNVLDNFMNNTISKMYKYIINECILQALTLIFQFQSHWTCATNDFSCFLGLIYACLLITVVYYRSTAKIIDDIIFER